MIDKIKSGCKKLYITWYSIFLIVVWILAAIASVGAGSCDRAPIVFHVISIVLILVSMLTKENWRLCVLLFASIVVLFCIPVGQSLCNNSHTGATVGQIQKLDTAYNTFRRKYEGIPGDLVNAREQFSGNTLNGNGDGLITDLDGKMDSFDGEMSRVFEMFGAAGMVDGTYVSGAFSYEAGEATAPRTKLKKGGISLGSVNGKNYWYVGTQDGVTLTVGQGLSPAEAYGIDFKLDDGSPLTGNTQYTPRLNEFGKPHAPNSCIKDGEYNLVGDEDDCAIAIKVAG